MLGLHKLKDDTGIRPLLGSTSRKYKFPLTYPDTASVGAKIVGTEEDRFSKTFMVVSRRTAGSRLRTTAWVLYV